MVVGAAVGMCGPGTKSMAAEASGMSRNTVIKAVSEVEAGIESSDRVRTPGAGVKPITETQPDLLAALDELVHPETRGNPMSLLRWTSKSTADLAKDLVRQGFTVSDDTVGRLLKRLGFSLRAPSKSKELTKHPDRNGQFEYLNATAAAYVADGQPVISVDTKKKELVGEYTNGGVEYQAAGQPVALLGHVTSAFAVATIRRWWEEMGRTRFPGATKLLITADAGVSNATSFPSFAMVIGGPLVGGRKACNE